MLQAILTWIVNILNHCINDDGWGNMTCYPICENKWIVGRSCCGDGWVKMMTSLFGLTNLHCRLALQPLKLSSSLNFSCSLELTNTFQISSYIFRKTINLDKFFVPVVKNYTNSDMNLYPFDNLVVRYSIFHCSSFPTSLSSLPRKFDSARYSSNWSFFSLQVFAQLPLEQLSCQHNIYKARGHNWFSMHLEAMVLAHK